MNLKRYNRQIILPDFGNSAQKKMANSSVLVVGAGGLGCPVLQILVSSGVGKIGIVDFDFLEIHNLHRQFLFDEKDVGRSKVVALKEILSRKNSETEIEIFNEKLTVQNAVELIEKFDVIADCTDNFATRYLLNDVCFLLKKPLVYASIFRYEGQVSVFNLEKDNKISNYRDLFPVPPNADEVPNCNEAGVLPAHSAIIGTFQANELIKIITNSEDTLVHQLLVFNTKNYQSMKINYHPSKENLCPKTIDELQEFNYDEFCNIHINSNLESESKLQFFMNQENSILIDVRETDEQPKLEVYKTLEIPLSLLENNLEKLKSYEHLCFICASGIRSKKALNLAKSYFPEKEVKHFSLGINSII